MYLIKVNKNVFGKMQYIFLKHKKKICEKYVFRGLKKLKIIKNAFLEIKIFYLRIRVR